MKIKIAIWGSNCVGKTYISEIIKNNSKYKISLFNIFQDTFATNIINKRRKWQKVIRFLYKTILRRQFVFARRYFWIKSKYESYYSISNDSEIILYEEGLIKKMYEIFPFEIENQKELTKLFNSFIYISPELLLIEEEYMDGFLYVYSDPENIISNMNMRNFYTSEYEDNILLRRYRIHNLLYSFLILLCEIKGLPVIEINSYEDKEEIIRKFEIFIENIMRRKISN